MEIARQQDQPGAVNSFYMLLPQSKIKYKEELKLTYEELRAKLSDEEASELDITEVREAIAEADEIIAGLDTRVKDLEVDLDNTKEALDKARVQNAKYFNRIEVKDDELDDLEKDKEKYYATDEEFKEVFD